MKNLIRWITIIAAIGATPERLTLQQFCSLYADGLYKLPDFGKFAKDWKRQTTSIGWGILDHRAWIPMYVSRTFVGGVYYDGTSSGTITTTTNFRVEDGICRPLKIRTESDIETKFVEYPMPIWPDPTEPNDIIVSSEPFDPNALILQAEELLDKDPNDPGLRTIVELLKTERR